MKCPICGETGAKVFGQWPEFRIDQCHACGFRYIDTADPGYPADAQYHYDEPEIGLIRPDLPHIQRRVRDILRHQSPPGRALDIGCGKGEVALALNRSGFVATGSDMKCRIMTHLQAHHSEVEWLNATAEELAALPQRFDVLTLYHVLEHVSDPRAVLASVKELANSGALIVIEVPNVAGLNARLRGQRWEYYKVDHVNYFRARDLHRLAADLDLTVLETRGYQHFSYPQNVPWKDAIKGALALVGFRDVVSVFLRA